MFALNETLAKALYTNKWPKSKRNSIQRGYITAIYCIFQLTCPTPLTLSHNNVGDVPLGSHLDLVEFELEAEQLSEHG